MRRMRLGWIQLGVLVCVSVFVFTACTASLSGGLMGGLLSILIFVCLSIGLAASTTSCEVSACLSPLPPSRDAEVGPCLTAPPPEMGTMDPRDAEVGPCLQPIPSEAGMPREDAGPDAPDARIGPCLSQAAPDPDAAASASPIYREAPPGDAATPDRAEAMARVLARGGLPDDVVARLKKGGDFS